MLNKSIVLTARDNGNDKKSLITVAIIEILHLQKIN